jgi:hypothetical protein
MDIIAHIVDAAKGKHPINHPRSSRWPTVRKAHLAANPNCAACGGSDKLEVHHVAPFHLHPELELDPNNLVTLCESLRNGVNCHLLFGHLGNFRSLNTTVGADSAAWLVKLQTRPIHQSE